MVSGDELIEFEQDYYDELVEEFLIQYAGEWGDFVARKYVDSVSDRSDYLEEVARGM